MSADRGGADESAKNPGASREPTGGEDETQGTAGTATAGTTAARTAIAGTTGGYGSDSARAVSSGKGEGGLSSPPIPVQGAGVDSSRRGLDSGRPDKGAPPTAIVVEKVAQAPMSAPRQQVSVSHSRKKRKRRMKKAAEAAVAAVGGGTIDDGQGTEQGGGNYKAAYPGEYEAMLWKQLEMFKRHNMFQRFPVEASPEQLVADLMHTYVKTIELTMEKRYRNIKRNCWLSLLLSLSTLVPLFVFVYKHIIEEDDLYVMEHWSKGVDWPWFLYPLVIHLITWPIFTVPLIFCTRKFLVYNVAANCYIVPLLSGFITAALVLYVPTTPDFEMIVDRAVDGAMRTARHLEEASTENTRLKVAGVYMSVAIWAGAQSLVCCMTFIMSMRTVSALRYYKTFTFEADHPALTAECADRAALVGQCTKHVPLTTYKNIAETVRSPGSRPGRSIPASPSPMQATAIGGENTPLI